MNKIALIISREYFTRVKKKSFIVMTILGPILFAAMIVLPAYLAQMEDDEEKRIAVVDDTHLFTNIIPSTQYMKFEYLDQSLPEAKANFQNSEYYGILYIPSNILHNAGRVQLFTKKQPSIGIQSHIENSLEKDIEKLKLKKYNISDIDNILAAVKTNISLETYKWTDGGEEKTGKHEISMAIGYINGFIMYMFILLFGVQVMRGVIEEKTNRIVEVIISSVKPFQLMMGKILGIAAVGLTQFIAWIILTVALVTILQPLILPDNSMEKIQKQQTEMLQSGGIKQAQPVNTENLADFNSIFDSLKQVNFVLIIAVFLFYFLGGYLLYASLFAAVGAAVDNETDTQQFMTPITIPLIIALVVMLNAISNPEGQLAFWFSIIPFTSPIVMVARVSFGIPVWELLLSASLLILTFLATTWMAGKIYRVGILMYGKKVNYAELWKWMKYKN